MVSLRSIRDYRRRRRQERRDRPYADNAFPHRLDYRWEDIRYNRVSLINAALARRGGATARYLEIGCAGNACFDSILALDKIGVDPARGGTHRMTSDAFFAANDRRFDVVFVDGLHEFAQCRRDAVHAIDVCEVGGFVLFHDFLPRDWRSANVPALQGEWTGDVWKTAFELASSDGIEFKLVEIDHGVGVARKIRQDWRYADRFAALQALKFKDLYARHRELPLIGPHDALRWIAA
ncbi:MAG: class I SAM-dependent methyltransferase [Alphaproteobacteria bacterium]|nr:class I SAM-dependent methyltransferase [Alphaproteobacteria bacterium]